MDKCIESFVDAINDYILSKNTSPTAFAREIGCRDCCVSRWLNGTNTPSLEYVLMVADYFNCSVDYLFGLSENKAYKSAQTKSTFAERFLLLQAKSKKASILLQSSAEQPRQQYRNGCCTDNYQSRK